MANTILTPDEIADAAIATLYENAVMAGLVSRDYDDDFANRVGDTITIREPATFVANDFDRSSPGITIQDATEGSQTVTLDKFKDVSFAVTAEELTLEIRDFAEQLLTPAMEALWQQIDVDLLALRGDVVNAVGNSTDDSNSKYSWDDGRVLIDAGRVLNKAKVPVSNRRAVVGPIATAGWLGTNLFHEADKRGDTVGLTEAELGRKFGHDNYMDQHVDDLNGTVAADEEVGVAFHRDAFTLVTRQLSLPRGAQNAAVRNYKGFGLRVVYDYDTDKKQDVVSIDCLYGTKTLDPDRAVLIKPADAA
ncbi:P22 coat protein - gene protein 5 [Haloechinothrix alba]|uniref:P22 coat protein - gene protein 5 n=1 Tax=Haloechinothrix alba TaxID=664784 RepID=A0A238WCJ3_9PSEU|nr:P22 phage major capsid protein family protein [Haloechinothrix alba]SNR44198.1 P22 coat protein - gene protein 5 [Haloechinothrix alba]